MTGLKRYVVKEVAWGFANKFCYSSNSPFRTLHSLKRFVLQSQDSISQFKCTRWCRNVAEVWEVFWPLPGASIIPLANRILRLLSRSLTVSLFIIPRLKYDVHYGRIEVA